MHTDIREVAQRGRELLLDAGVQPRARAARGVDLALDTWMDLARGHDPRALRARDRAAERVVADVGDEVLEWAGGIFGGFWLVLGRPRLFVFEDALGITHAAEDTGAAPPDARPIGPSVRAYVFSAAYGGNCRKPAQSVSARNPWSVAA